MLVQVSKYTEAKKECLAQGDDATVLYFEELERAYKVDDLEQHLFYMPVTDTIEEDVNHLEYVCEKRVSYTTGTGGEVILHTQTMPVYRYNGILYAQQH